MKRKNVCLWLSALSLMGVLSGCEDNAASSYILKCVPGEAKCESGTLKTCLGTDWLTLDCTSGECLEDGSNCKLNADQICTPGEIKCNADNTAIVTCIEEGKTIQETSCNEGDVCNMTTGKVECTGAHQILECNPGEIKCSEDHKGTISCNDINKFDEPVACPQDKPVCNDEKKACEEADISLTCTEGDRKCEGTNALKICKADGTWGGAVPCADPTPICSDTAQDCVPDDTVECEPGEILCGSGKAYQCNMTGDKLGLLKTCDTNEYCVPGEGCVERPTSLCTPADLQCFDTSAYQVCSDYGWGNPIACSVSTQCDYSTGQCSPIPEVPCTEADNICDADGVSLWECHEGKLEKVPCTNETPICQGNACITNSTITDCAPNNEARCDTATNTLYLCDALGHWDEGTVCSPTQTCNADLKKCIDNPVSCLNGQKKCIDSHNIQICVGGVWTNNRCANGYVCTNNQCIPTITPECSNMRPTCNDDILTECIDGRLVKTNCKEQNQVCDPSVGRCVTTVLNCTEGDRRCADENTSLVCKKNEWVKDPCPTDYTCDKATGKCISIYLECKEGDIACLSDYLGYKYCDGGVWIKRPCRNGMVCDPATVTCQEKPTECKTGDQECYDSSVYRYCKGGIWFYEPCKDGAYCDSNVNACVDSNLECKNGQKHCQDSFTLAVCKDNKWTYQSCDNNTYCSEELLQCTQLEECTDGERYCNASDTLMICERGKWVPTMCAKSQYCDKKLKKCVNYVLECREGDMECLTHTTLAVCQAGVWTKRECSKSEYCDANRNECVSYNTECNPGEVKCYDDKTLNVCGNDGKWYTQRCPSDTPFCYTGMSACVQCIPGDTKCKDDMTVFECNRSGKWASHSCGESQVCRNGVCENILFECKPGSAYCDDIQTSVYCNGGFWEKNVCNKSQYCNQETGLCEKVIVCKEGDLKCSDNNKYIQVCRDNKWVTSKYCSANTEICKDAVCVCKEDGLRKCDSHTPLHCENHEWIKDEECTRSEICMDDFGSVCVPINATCEPPRYGCKSHGIVTKCYEGLWTPVEKCKEDQSCVPDGSGWAMCKEGCDPGTYSCSDDLSEILVCSKNGMDTEVIDKCGKSERCIHPDGEKPSCVKNICDEMTYSCGTENGHYNTIYVCTNGELKPLVDCKKYGMVCKEGECLYQHFIIKNYSMICME